jgi:hypothetical protein
MSHFTMLVIGPRTNNELAAALAPFDEDLAVEPYIDRTKADLIADRRKKHAQAAQGLEEFLAAPKDYNGLGNRAHMRWIIQEAPVEAALSDDELWEKVIVPRQDGLDAEGNVWTTYNPLARWDWYAVGGRWKGLLTTTDLKQVDSAPWGELIKPVTPTFAVLKDGKWYENGRMGWWGIVHDETPAQEWGDKFTELVADLSPETVVTVVDLHI